MKNLIARLMSLLRSPPDDVCRCLPCAITEAKNAGRVLHLGGGWQILLFSVPAKVGPHLIGALLVSPNRKHAQCMKLGIGRPRFSRN